MYTLVKDPQVAIYARYNTCFASWEFLIFAAERQCFLLYLTLVKTCRAAQLYFWHFFLSFFRDTPYLTKPVLLGGRIEIRWTNRSADG